MSLTRCYSLILISIYSFVGYLSCSSLFAETQEFVLSRDILGYARKYRDVVVSYEQSGAFLPVKSEVFYYQLEYCCEVLAKTESFDFSVYPSYELHLEAIQFFQKRVATIAIAAAATYDLRDSPDMVSEVLSDYTALVFSLNKYESSLLKYVSSRQ